MTPLCYLVNKEFLLKLTRVSSDTSQRTTVIGLYHKVWVFGLCDTRHSTVPVSCALWQIAQYRLCCLSSNSMSAVSDEWEAYREVQQLQPVSTHSLQFVDPATGVHTHSQTTSLTDRSVARYLNILNSGYQAEEGGNLGIIPANKNGIVNGKPTSALL